MENTTKKRSDSNRRILRKGESQRKNGSYMFRWSCKGTRYTIYAKTLNELRDKETEIQKNQYDGIRHESIQKTVNDIYEIWRNIKKGLKDNTFQNYKYMYETFVKPDLGEKKLLQLRKSDVKTFYNMLVDERNLKSATVDGVHTVLHQVLEIAVEDNYIRANPSDGALTELKRAHKKDEKRKHALSAEEENVFLSFLWNSEEYLHWYPTFAVMVGTGMRVGELTGLRWCDIDFEEKEINVNHTLVYYNHAIDGCYYNIHSPKTESGNRKIPMTQKVIEALKMEKEYQLNNRIFCSSVIDGYTDFVFLNRFGKVQNQGTLNKALRRIMRDYNEKAIESEQNPTLLPRFSCHNLRHTFATRLCENEFHIKYIQDIMGHADIQTTMNIYVEATKDFKKKQLMKFESAQNNITDLETYTSKPNITPFGKVLA